MTSHSGPSNAQSSGLGFDRPFDGRSLKFPQIFEKEKKSTKLISILKEPHRAKVFSRRTRKIQ